MAAEKMREIKVAIPEELFRIFLPTTTQDHLLKAKKELLLAIRSLIDARIEGLEKREGQKTETKRKIKIE